jgi:hypothetical protein
MTRKDYKIIAAAFKDSKPKQLAEQSALTAIAQFKQWEHTVTAIAAELQRDNPRFIQAKFFKACGTFCNSEKSEIPENSVITESTGLTGKPKITVTSKDLDRSGSSGFD